MSILTREIANNIDSFKTKLKTHYYIDYNPSYQNTVFLAGVARSGTTWLSNIINYNNNYRYMFEPFYEKEINICKNFRPKQYIEVNSNEKNFLGPAKVVLSGQVRSAWSDRFNEKIFINKRLIKSIRANLFLKWLHLNFPNLPIVLILRHPCAVAASKNKLNWKRSLDKYLKQENLMEDFLSPFSQEMERAEELYQSSNDSFENHIFSWCIENYVPLKQFKPDEIYIIFYENICKNPEAEVKKLFTYLKQKYDKRVLSTSKRVSKLSRKDSAIVTGESLIDSWRQHLTDKQIDKACEILSLFSLEEIYSQDSFPYVDNIYQVMKP